MPGYDSGFELSTENGGPCMAKKNLSVKLELLLLVVLLGAFCWRIQYSEAKSRGSAYHFVDPLVIIRRQIMDHYVELPNRQVQHEMQLGAINGMLEALHDRYTVYHTPEQQAQFRKDTQGKLVGVGIQVQLKNDRLLIVTPLADSPALKAGIRAGDIITAIDSHSTRGMDLDQAVKRITGDKGSIVRLTVDRDGKQLVFDLQRDDVMLQSVRGWRQNANGQWQFMINPKRGIGYIRLEKFSQPSYEELKAALDQLQAKQMRGLILDLRFNPGGLLDTAEKMADLFLEHGTIVSTKARNAQPVYMKAHTEGTLPEFPMIVLVNEHSASASEILAGALKFNHRAIVLGTRTTGKGSVQQLIDLPGDQGALKLTTSYYYLPNNQNIHRRPNATRWGVDPNDGFYVPTTTRQLRRISELFYADQIIQPRTQSADNPIRTIRNQWLQLHLNDDPQFAAAYRSMTHRLTTGKFLPTGKSDADLQAHLSEMAELAERKQYLQQELAKLEQDMQTLEHRIAQPANPPATQPAIDHEAQTQPDQP